jgi:AcrR family transcriptional regulator
MPRKKETNLEMRTYSRAALLSAARHLFAEQGYENCTVSAIARAAGMSSGNVYWYFSSKEELLKAVLADGFETMEAMMEKAASRSDSALEKFNLLVDEFLLFARERGDFATIFLSLTARAGAGRLQELGFDTMQIGMRYHRHVAFILIQGQSEGTVVADIDPKILTMFFFAFFNGLMLTYRTDWTMAPTDLIHQAVLRLIGSGTERELGDNV